MEKKIEYYLRLPYTRELIPEPEGGWFIRIKELPGCMSQGETVDEAMDMIGEAMTGWIEVNLERGLVIPEPRTGEDYSGKFVLRVSKSLHRKLVETAEEERVSLNQLVNASLAETVGFLQAKSLFSPGTPSESAEENVWEGLENSASDILESLCGKKPENSELEKQFTEWLDHNQKTVWDHVESGDYSQAKSKCDAWQYVIAQNEGRSPFIAQLNKFISTQKLLLEQLSDRENEINRTKRAGLQISQIISSLYDPATTKVKEVNNVEFTASSKKKEVELKNILSSLQSTGEFDD